MWLYDIYVGGRLIGIDKDVDINTGYHLKTKYDGDDGGDNDDKVDGMMNLFIMTLRMMMMTMVTKV